MSDEQEMVEAVGYVRCSVSTEVPRDADDDEIEEELIDELQGQTYPDIEDAEIITVYR